MTDGAGEITCEPQSELPGGRPGWLEQATAWIDAQMLTHGVQRTGKPKEPHTYPWSKVLRLPTAGGVVWFKAPVSACAHEVGITQALADWRPGDMVDLLAADRVHGWMLMRDGGPVWRSPRPP